MDLNEEQEWVRQSRKDPEAFGKLFDHYYAPILGYIVRRVGDFAVAEDLTSEVFYKAFHKLWQFQFRSLPFSAWLYRIATNHIRSHFRGRKVALSLENLMEELGFDAPSDVNIHEEAVQLQTDFETHQDFLQLQKKLQSLPMDYQEVVALRFLGEKKLSEIAQILGKKEGTVKSLLSRGLKKLRDL